MTLSGLLNVVTLERVFGYSVLFVVIGFVLDYTALPQHPKSIPAFGHGQSLWANLRNSVAYFTRYRSWITDGYLKYGKEGLPFVVPASISRASDVVLPRSLVSWFMEQPDTALSADEAHEGILYGKYNFLDPRVAHESFGTRVIYKHLSRNLATLVPEIDDEVGYAVDFALRNVSDEWTTINLWDMWLDIVPRVTNRMLAGRGACRDDLFLQSMISFADDVVRSCIFLRMFPKALHPIFGRLLTLPNWLHWWRAHRRLLPTIQQRLQDMKRQAEGAPELEHWVPPDDFISWYIRLALAEQRLEELDPTVISKHLLPLEFASIHTTVLTGHSWLLDLLTTAPGDRVLDVLRDELKAHKPAAGPWTKSALLSLVRVDSSIRESQRLSNFHATLVERVVVSPDGIRHPGFDWTLPKGIFVTVNLEGTHHDEDIYPHAQTYDPLRFSRIREAWEKKPEEERRAAADEGRKVMGLGMVTTSDQHFAFGLGRHACPGRFFVAHELKLVMAHLLLNYDVEMLSERPKPQWVGSQALPPLKAQIRVRRRRCEKA
ncbi:hypothetical protein PCL_02709 [Purpureocillium lilacinum]|uniref:Cytochrome P450 n=1 Tax=Purpureocillium lilacinum TaxID=33203 RepID=A0A2U3DZV1_PURLI|nr:hypothetical protein PCL_02709 [Purpureocillium lilacinum]GJN73740.1 hypothetical protein PLICBS_007823 [Purpureocillium lilacinum]